MLNAREDQLRQPAPLLSLITAKDSWGPLLRFPNRGSVKEGELEHILFSTLYIFRMRKVWFYKPFTFNARVFHCCVFKRRLKTPSDCGNCKSFIDPACDQNDEMKQVTPLAASFRLAVE
jgi:hypothetical protein